MNKVVCPYCGSSHWSVYDGNFDDDVMEFENYATCRDCQKEFSLVYHLKEIKKKA